MQAAACKKRGKTKFHFYDIFIVVIITQKQQIVEIKRENMLINVRNLKRGFMRINSLRGVKDPLLKMTKIPVEKFYKIKFYIVILYKYG